MKKPNHIIIRNTGIICITLGPAFLALITFKSRIPVEIKNLFSQNILSFTNQYLPLFSMILIILGVFLLFISLLPWCKDVTEKVIAKLHRKQFDYLEIQATKQDLVELYTHYDDLFGNDNIPIEQMESWFDKNDSILWKIVKIPLDNSNENHKLIGFYDIEPLTRSGESKIRMKKTGASALKKGDILSNNSVNSHSFYIGSVGSPVDANLYDKGITMGFFVNRIKELGAQKTINIYTKPATVKGMYLVKELFRMNKRHQGPDTERIWSKEINSGKFRLPRNYQKRFSEQVIQVNNYQ